MKTYIISLLLFTTAQFSMALELENVFEPARNKTALSARAGGGEWRSREFSLVDSRKFKAGEGDTIGLSPRVTYQTLEMVTLGRTPGFLTGKVAASYGSLFSSREIFYAQAGVLASQEMDRTSKTLWAPEVIGVATYHLSENFVFLYGAGFTFLLDQDHFFPVLGARWKISEKFQLLAVLPLLIQLSYAANDVISVVAFIKPSGFKSKLKNDGALAGQPEDLDIRSGSVTVGSGLRYHMRKDLTFKADVGIQANRRVSIYSGANKVAGYELARGGFLKLELEMRY